MQFRQYDVVKIVEIISLVKVVKSPFNLRAPKVGDIATIVEIYSSPCLAYEVECADDAGITQWLITFKPTEIGMVLL